VPIKRFAGPLTLLALLVLSAPAIAQHPPTPPPPDPSLHVYRETMDGGVQIAVIHGVSHAKVSALRSQLRAQAKAYQRGDYQTPAGSPAPASLGTLRAGASRITVTYTDIQDGGAIKLRTKDQALVAAIYDLFAAEVAGQRRAHPLGGPGDT
jgi:hypothetical protein